MPMHPTSYTLSPQYCGRIFFCTLFALLVAATCLAEEAPYALPDSSTPLLRVKVTAARQTVLSSQTGGRIARLAVRDGEAFEKNQILAQIDAELPLAQLRRAEAAVQKARAIYNTTRKLESLQSRSQLELTVAKAEADQAAAEAAAAKIFVDNCTIRAPFSGRVADCVVQENQFVSEGQPLFEIVDPSELELEFIAPSSWIPWFTPGHTFSVFIDETQKSYEAKLTRLSGKVDAVSQSIKAYGVFVTRDDLLLPGMSGAAHIAPQP